jgi:hypothetical protein
MHARDSDRRRAAARFRPPATWRGPTRAEHCGATRIGCKGLIAAVRLGLAGRRQGGLPVPTRMRPVSPKAAELGWASPGFAADARPSHGCGTAAGRPAPSRVLLAPVSDSEDARTGHSGRRHCAARVGQQPPLRVAAAGPRGRAAASRAGAGPIAFAQRAGTRRPLPLLSAIPGRAARCRASVAADPSADWPVAAAGDGAGPGGAARCVSPLLPPHAPGSVPLVTRRRRLWGSAAQQRLAARRERVTQIGDSDG